ncbi:MULTISPECIES: 5'-nucleotidase [Shewanella]|uniref:5'-nucleotidase n=1 Tax=Shewanella TaxID=22 RepID=UPI0021D804F1|nr:MULTISPECIES: 5'-nucleotidase [Shewanella]MCU7964631.1 5'-nucleotidase [Shewanella sp. SW32]MCU7972556.1 5'-nucleotidase [Shewanella sp. SW29]MCU7997423.1 5'-nucleotidase [Shewanella sp. SM95]MCU8005452.1 5'-nucleotidase [Shewanella sp. SM96]MCU8023476.1 5'-nucleotidase [Shewanella sp. SM78]
MPLDLSNTLVVGISATALFDMAESDQIFRKTFESDPDTAIEKYREFMLAHEDEPLKPGTGYPLIKALLGLNQYQQGNSPLVEVVVMSQNSPDTGLRVLNTIRHDKLNITRSAFTAGETVADYLDAFDVDLFLTTNVKDAQQVIDSKNCAAAILKAPPTDAPEIPEGQVRIAFDGDAVLFSDESELVYKTQGMEAFHAQEDAKQNIPMAEGPYASLLHKLSRLQDRLPIRVEYSPIRIALVTARNSPSEMRVIKTLRHWGVYVDEAFFLGGVEKTKVLKAFRPHIFFDDQDVHLDAAANLVPSGKVPYLSDSALSEKLASDLMSKHRE